MLAVEDQGEVWHPQALMYCRHPRPPLSQLLRSRGPQRNPELIPRFVDHLTRYQRESPHRNRVPEEQQQTSTFTAR